MHGNNHLLAARQAASTTSPTSTSTASSSSSSSSFRSSSSSSTSKITQPTTVIPLTTTFTPPASCTRNHLSQNPPPGYLIWNNEPVPAANHTSSDCFPQEFLRAYTSVNASITGSSVVPAMSPLVCPANYCTQIANEDNYVACCPSDYTLHRPDNTVDAKRPAYGGTCYSDFTVGSTYTVTAYDISGDVQTALWVASTSGAQAYAHPIDGWATTSPVIGCPTVSSSSNSTAPTTSSSSSTTTATAAASPKLSTGAIVGVSIGGACFLAAIGILLWALLRWSRARHRSTSPPSPRPKIVHLRDGKDRSLDEPDVEVNTSEKGMAGVPVEIGSSGNPFDHAQAELDGGLHGPFEMNAEEIPELSAESEKRISDKQWAIAKHNRLAGRKSGGTSNDKGEGWPLQEKKG